MQSDNNEDDLLRQIDQYLEWDIGILKKVILLLDDEVHSYISRTNRLRDAVFQTHRSYVPAAHRSFRNLPLPIQPLMRTPTLSFGARIVLEATLSQVIS
jgi:hypothetical protein